SKQGSGGRSQPTPSAAILLVVIDFHALTDVAGEPDGLPRHAEGAPGRRASYRPRASHRGLGTDRGLGTGGHRSGEPAAQRADTPVAHDPRGRARAQPERPADHRDAPSRSMTLPGSVRRMPPDRRSPTAWRTP